MGNKRFPRRLLVSTALTALGLAAAYPVVADDFIIDTPVFVTNGGFPFNNNDTFTVTSTGSITPAAGSGVSGGDNSTIINAGVIATTGASAQAIQMNSRNTLTNSGTVSAGGDFSPAVDGDDDNIISNSGTMTTGGDTAHVIAVENRNTIANTGTISATGPGSTAVRVNDDSVINNWGGIFTNMHSSPGISMEARNTVTNWGTISTTGDFSDAINGDEEDNFVSNFGTITVTGDSATAVFLDRDGTVINAGTVRSSGTAGTGIYLQQRGQITNSGSVVSTQGLAIHVDQDATLNLLAPSFIGGRIDLGTNATVNITSGPSHSILWDLSDGTMVGGMPTLMGSVPIFYNQATQQVAIFDPSGFAGSGNALADTAGNISGLIRSRNDAARRGAGSSVEPLGFFPIDGSGNGALDAMADMGSEHEQHESGWWMSGFGSLGEYDGAGGALDQTFDQYGFAVGYDAVVSPSLSFGVLGGYGWGSFGSESRFANAFSNDADGVFAALYGQQRTGIGTIQVSLAGGALSHSDSRFVNDNLAPLGVSQATASYGSWWLSPEVRVAAEFAMGDWVFTPSAQLGYAMQWIEGFTETGPSAANAVVGSRDVATLDARVELSATRQLGFGSLTVRGGWQQRHALGDDGVGVAMLGQTQIVGFDSNLGGGAFVGLQSDIALDDRFLLQVSGEALLGAARTLRASASLRMSF